MPSSREFYDIANWKKKRYNNVLVNANTTPTDFEMWEMQDIANFELQQYINNANTCGFIGDGFKVVTNASGTTVKITQGVGFVQDQSGATLAAKEEFSGIRLVLPDILTGSTEEHVVSAGYYTYTLIPSTPPPSGANYRYDLIYVEFYRKTYSPDGVTPPGITPLYGADAAIEDTALGATANREKWYYEFKYATNASLDTPVIAIPSLSADHYAVKLAVIKTHTTGITPDNVTADDIIDVRPKFSDKGTTISDNAVTVGPQGGQYPSLKDVIDNRTTATIISPSASQPYEIKMMPGVHTCNYAINFGTMGHIIVKGAGKDITILEFDDAYSLMAIGTPWITIGATAGIEFRDLTIRIKSGTYTTDNWLMTITGGIVNFTHCRIGDVGANPSSMKYGGISISNGYVNLEDCGIYSRSLTKQALAMSGTSTVQLFWTGVYQSGYRAVDTSTGTRGTLVINESQINCNKTCLYGNGIVNSSNSIFFKQEWNTGDTVTTTDDSVYVLQPSKFWGLQMQQLPSAVSGYDVLHVSAVCDFVGCYNDDIVLSDTVAAVRFYSSTLTTVNVTNNTTFKARTCGMTTVTVSGGSAAQLSGSGITTLTVSGAASSVSYSSGTCTTMTVSDTSIANVRSVDIGTLNFTSTSSTPSIITGCTITTVAQTGANVLYLNSCEITTLTPSSSSVDTVVSSCVFIGTQSWASLTTYGFKSCTFRLGVTLTSMSSVFVGCSFSSTITFVTANTSTFENATFVGAITWGTATSNIAPVFTGCLFVANMSITTVAPKFIVCSFVGSFAATTSTAVYRTCNFLGTATFTTCTSSAKMSECTFVGLLTLTDSSPLVDESVITDLTFDISAGSTAPLIRGCQITGTITPKNSASVTPTIISTEIVGAISFSSKADIFTFVNCKFDAAVTLTSCGASKFQSCSFLSTYTITSTNTNLLGCIHVGDISITTASPQFLSCDIQTVTLVTGAGSATFRGCDILLVTSITTNATPVFSNCTFETTSGTAITITGSAAPEIRSCFFQSTSAATCISMTSAGAVTINNCNFFKDGTVITITTSTPNIRRSNFMTSGTTADTTACIRAIGSGAVFTVDFCRFTLTGGSNADNNGIFLNKTGGNPTLVITHSHCSCTGANARLIQANAAGGNITVQAQYVSATVGAIAGGGITLSNSTFTNYP